MCILCYADFLVIISETAEGLQTMLDIVKQWCSKWSMAVNTKKTQMVHFRAASMPRSNYMYTYGDLPIVILERYTYLGLMLTEFLDYHITASIVAKSAGRALGLLITKYKAFGGLPYDCYTKLYDSLVQPIIDYGSSVWDTKEYSCINAIQHRACHFYMGVGKHTSHAAIQGDMGLILPSQRQWINVTRY